MVAAIVIAPVLAAFVALLLLRDHLSRQLVVRLDRITARVGQLEKATPAGVDPATPISLRAQCSYLHWTLPRQRDSWKVWFYRTARAEISTLESWLTEIELGNDPLHQECGLSLRAYRSPVDGGVTTYSLRVPEEYDSSGQWPLIVHLHGRGKLQPFQGHRAPDYGEDVIVIAPHGKGSVDYMGPAEADVLAGIEEVKRLYRIDNDRVYLAGASMGGTGAWHLAVHYPDRFAAVVAASANADDRVWETLWEGVPRAARQGSVGWALERLERHDSPVSYAANMLHVPARVIHGDDDQVVPVEHARSMVAALKENGGGVEYHELVGAGHDVGYGRSLKKQAAWLLKHRRARNPKRIHYATDGRWPGAYWLTHVRPESALVMAEVDAEVASGNEILVTTAGCAGLALDLASAPVTDSRALRLSVDGEDLGEVTREQVFLVRKNGNWRRSEEIAAFCPREFSQVFWRKFAIIYGTGAEDTKLGEALRREADRLAAEWRRRYFASPRMYADSEVSEEVLHGCGLILFGGPAENSITARAVEAAQAMSSGPPFSILSDGVVIEGSRIEGAELETLGLQFSWPSPFARGRQISVVWGASWRALVDSGSRFGRSFDWTVYENRRWFDYALYDARTCGPESFLKVGFYGPDWKIDEQRSWGRSASAAKDAPGSAPRFRSVADSDGKDDLWLEEVLPARVQQMRGAVGYGRSWGGCRLSVGRSRTESRHGLGVKGPSKLSYDIGGRFKRFRSRIGADLEGRKLEEFSEPRVKYGSMRFTVRGDGRPLYVSDPLGPSEESVDIDLDISGVKELTLEVVAAGKYGWHLGSGAWADARLER